SRETLAQLRRLLVGLRGAPEDPPHPSTGLAELDGLVARTGAAGVRIEVERRGGAEPLPAEVDLAAYRIIQEALANVVRHTGGADCRVVIDRRPDDLVIEMTDDGPGAPPAGAGYGLVEMRERGAVLGGTSAAGLRPAGACRRHARITVGRW